MAKISMEEVKKRWSEGITRAAGYWAARAEQSTGAFGTNFAPFLDAQYSCSDELNSMRPRPSRYDALVAYASCMKGKMG